MSIPEIIESCETAATVYRLRCLKRACRECKREAIAHASGISTGGLTNLILGRRRITDFQWTRLTEGCKALGVTLENLPPSHR